ncbi:chorismate-binding protein [Muriicola sp. Z0-33]|uniref:chorismate-binding protein n=1 Tax=Muriicola sp. Z0-33 TaxID=2816957 RepID=UPI0022384440|nr:chorismate-binding protein [Muriicola sp. Z0-33]MCW5516598.1 chorismate-binding protein [Muriicola sp. Z0-33]
MFLDLLKKAEAHYQKCLPFVLYRKPEETKVLGIFQNNNQLHTTAKYEDSGFVFAPFDSHGTTVLIPPDEQIIAEYITPREKTKSFKWDGSNASEKSKHLERISEALKQINTGRIKKVVLSRKVEVAVSADPLAIFQEILSLYPRAFCYLWFHPAVGVWSGASPETFLNISNGRLTTMSLAGTKRVNENDLPEWGSKEIEEQGMVTSYILNVLGTLISGIKASNVVSVKAGNLWHLKSIISGNMKNISLEAVIEALHPTPAVCGLPLLEAQRFVSEHESYDREYYSGFLGELNMGGNMSTQLFVNLRCLKVQDELVNLYIGGGITKDSIPENEWLETHDKMEIMGRALFNSQD